jgi:hypothetical protein
VAAGRHVALAGLAGLDVDDAVEEVGFAVLAAEILGGTSVSERGVFKLTKLSGDGVSVEEGT